MVRGNSDLAKHKSFQKLGNTRCLFVVSDRALPPQKKVHAQVKFDHIVKPHHKHDNLEYTSMIDSSTGRINVEAMKEAVSSCPDVVNLPDQSPPRRYDPTQRSANYRGPELFPEQVVTNEGVEQVAAGQPRNRVQTIATNCPGSYFGFRLLLELKGYHLEEGDELDARGNPRKGH